MIVRILNEGQWELDRAAIQSLNPLDDAVEHAVSTGDQNELTAALYALLDRVRTTGSSLADDDLRDSELILPSADSTIAEVQALLDDSDQGLIPG